MLVCTDVAGMGIDVKDLNFSVNIGKITNIFKYYIQYDIFASLSGIPENAWKMKQQSGRIGRSGENSLDIKLVFPQKGDFYPPISLMPF